MLYTEKIAQEIKEKILGLELKVEDDDEWAFDVIASTEDKDRDGEVVKVDGWDTTNWLKNPVVLANHTYKIENIVGKGIEFYTSNGQKRLKGYFSKTNPLGVLAKQLYQEGMLKSVSVGFIVLKRNDMDYKIIEKAELLEVSFVAVPCNPNAISMDGKLFDEAVQKGLLIREKSLSVGESIDNKLRSLIMSEKSIVETSKQDIYVCDIFESEFVYNYYSYQDNNRFDKYFRRSYTNNDGIMYLSGDDVEVVSQRQWVDKKGLSFVINELSEIKEFIKSLADGKAEEKKIDIESEKALENKVILQEISKLTSTALGKMKLLKK